MRTVPPVTQLIRHLPAFSLTGSFRGILHDLVKQMQYSPHRIAAEIIPFKLP